MDAIHLRYGADHLRALFLAFCHWYLVVGIWFLTTPNTNYQLPITIHHTCFHTAARGSSGFSFASSRRISFDFSSRTFGGMILTSTISSPRAPSFTADGTPFSRRRNFCPHCVPGGIFSSVRPSMVGTSIFPPKPASVKLTGTVR